MDSGHAQELIRQVLPAYEVKELLGVGSFGSVFRIQDALKERAVKIVLLTAAPSRWHASRWWSATRQGRPGCRPR